jgi:transposase
MHLSDEPNVEVLRHKARILEGENSRLVKKTAELMREVLLLKGMATAQVEQNLPGLLAQLTSSSKASEAPGCTSERGPHEHVEAVEKKPQRGHGPTEQRELEVVRETFDVDEPDKTCPQCGGQLEEWTGHEDVTEVVDVVEHRWLVRQRVQKKYRCRCGGCIETALAPPKLIAGGHYTPEVAVHTAVAKYLDAIPLERQTRQARRQGAQLTTQALWDQLEALAHVLRELPVRIKEHILRQAVIGGDESPFKLIQKGGSIKWQAWQLSCPDAIYFEIMDSKSADAAARLLAGFAGTLVVDGAASYASLEKSEQSRFRIAACWSHARRKVLEARGETPGQVAEFIALVQELYAIEHEAIRGPPADDDPRQGYRHRVDIDKLRVLRDTRSREVIGRIQTWMLAQQCIPGGLLEAKLRYVSTRWTALTRFLDDPRIPLDNNRTEGAYIGLAIGRRNYIGARSERGTKVAATFYTLFESAKVCGVDGEAYLRYATAEALAGRAPLLPHEWATLKTQ